MKVMIRFPNEVTKQILLTKLRDNKICCSREVSRKCEYVLADVSKANSSILFELLEMGLVVERDVKNDLD